MEEVLHLDTSHSVLRSGGDMLALFRPGERVFALYDVANRSMRQCGTEYPVINVECTGRLVVVFHRELYNEYDKKTLSLLNTVNKTGITLKYMVGRSGSIVVRGNEMLMARDKKTAPVVQRIERAGIIRNRYFFAYSKNTLEIFESKNKAYSVGIPEPAPMWVDIRNEKVYYLQNDRIIGHDLNLYLDELTDFSPGRFTNLENEVLLYDSTRKELRLYQKNLHAALFSCSADDYVYDAASAQLFVVYDGRLIVYRRLNEYLRSFRLINESVAYAEQEDEFDESDSSHADLLVAAAVPPEH